MRAQHTLRLLLNAQCNLPPGGKKRSDSFALCCGQGGYATKVVRSKDLSTWEQAADAVLDFKPPGMVAADKGKPPRSSSKFYYTNFTATMVSASAHRAARLLPLLQARSKHV